MKLSQIFNVEYPSTLIFSNQKIDPNGINFVSSSGKNNGVVGKVKQDPKNKLFKKGSITVPLKGSVLSAFVQPEDFYSAHQIAILTSKTKMSLKNKQYYCLCIRKNIYRYNYGRQADRSLKEIKLPDNVPNWLERVTVPKIKDFSKSVTSSSMNLKEKKWKSFVYHELFIIKKGKRIINEQMKDGITPCIRPIESNNGVFKFIDIIPNHEKNTITISYNGSVGEAFYQPMDYFALDDINILYPKFQLNVYIAMFLITLIKLEKYRYSFGRKWNKERMEQSLIKLPVNGKNKPDWQFMEDYIKSLPYSINLKIVKVNSS